MANNSNDSIYFRYFVYSKTQAKEFEQVNKAMNTDTHRLGTVIVNGIQKYYTEKVRDLSKCRYGDSKVVASGDIRKIKHTPAI